MASSERTKGAAAAGTTAGAATGTASRTERRHAESGNPEGSGLRSAPESVSGPKAPATPLEACTISCLTNAQYHACREGFLDTVHRWFMFLVIALGAAALTDVLPKLILQIVGWHWETALVKELCAAGAAILAALDLTFDLSNRARAHAMMKRRYFELLADLREDQKTPEQVRVCLERFSAEEEPPYKVLLFSCWNAAQQAVYGNEAHKYNISFLGNLFKNWWRRPSADYPVAHN